MTESSAPDSPEPEAPHLDSVPEVPGGVTGIGDTHADEPAAADELAAAADETSDIRDTQADEPVAAADELAAAADGARPATAARAQRIPASARGVGLLVVGLAVIAAILYAVIPSSPSGQAANTAPSVNATPSAGSTAIPGPMPGAPSSPAAATTGKGGAKGTALADATAPKPLQPASKSQVASWNKGSGGTALSAVTVAADNAMMSRGTGAYPAMLLACRSLTAAVRQADAAPPIPDATMEREYTAALSAFKQGASGCLAGITQHVDGPEDTLTYVNKAVIGKASSALTTGLKDLYIATEVLRKQ
jgi:hypothetical protein